MLPTVLTMVVACAKARKNHGVLLCITTTPLFSCVTLEEQGLQHFDAWAANYGETVTAIELSPEGTGYRAKTRFAKFYNLPELMSVFKNVADIQTADMLKLPVPEAHYHNIALKPS